MHLRSNKILIFVFAAVWLSLTGAGLRILLSYESSPGDAGNPPKKWPVASRIERASGMPVLVMMAHPHCPCTRASIGELAMLMARVQGKVNAYVLFYKPSGSADGWEKTDLWKSAAAIPGVTVLSDVDGGEAHRFNIETSGHTLLFDPEGRQVFSGGITGSRGHSGDNEGRSAIVSLLTTGAPSRDNTFVFGCSLFDPNRQKETTLCSK